MEGIRTGEAEGGSCRRVELEPTRPATTEGTSVKEKRACGDQHDWHQTTNDQQEIKTRPWERQALSARLDEKSKAAARERANEREKPFAPAKKKRGPQRQISRGHAPHRKKEKNNTSFYRRAPSGQALEEKTIDRGAPKSDWTVKTLKRSVELPVRQPWGSPFKATKRPWESTEKANPRGSCGVATTRGSGLVQSPWYWAGKSAASSEEAPRATGSRERRGERKDERQGRNNSRSSLSVRVRGDQGNERASQQRKTGETASRKARGDTQKAAEAARAVVDDQP